MAALRAMLGASLPDARGSQFSHSRQDPAARCGVDLCPQRARNKKPRNPNGLRGF
jgi:hypothetical protein